LKVVILGAASSSLRLIPWDEPDVEFWAGSSFFRYHPNFASLVTRWFEIHPNIERLRAGWLGWAIKNQVKCDLQEVHSELPDSQAYPIDEMIEKYGRYFTSTASYMMVSAIDEGATDVEIYGVDMKGDFEYVRQRPCFEYFVGLACGKGVNVYCSGDSPVLRSEWLYGWEQPDEGWSAPIELFKALQEPDDETREETVKWAI
jgi:hypothetical protein